MHIIVSCMSEIMNDNGVANSLSNLLITGYVPF